MTTSLTFARRAYTWAGIAGIVMLVPQYFLEHQVGVDFPPAITHPEYFYGFVGLALVWQFAFLLIGKDPVRFRPLMHITWLEKLSFGGACVALFALGRVPVPVLAFGLLDLALGVLFVFAWLKTPSDVP